MNIILECDIEVVQAKQAKWFKQFPLVVMQL